MLRILITAIKPYENIFLVNVIQIKFYGSLEGITA
jgi:hypothetical protein